MSLKKFKKVQDSFQLSDLIICFEIFLLNIDRKEYRQKKPFIYCLKKIVSHLNVKKRSQYNTGPIEEHQVIRDFYLE